MLRQLAACIFFFFFSFFAAKIALVGLTGRVRGAPLRACPPSGAARAVRVQRGRGAVRGAETRQRLESWRKPAGNTAFVRNEI